jgi:hypothetical protein
MDADYILLRFRGAGFTWQGQVTGEKKHFGANQVEVKQARIAFLTRMSARLIDALSSSMYNFSIIPP